MACNAWEPETTSCFDHRGCMPMAQAEELSSSPFSFCCSISPSPLTCRTCRPVVSGLININYPTLHSILFRLFGVFLLNICFIIRQRWNGVGLAAQSRGRTIHLVLILLGRTLPSLPSPPPTAPPAPKALGPVFLLSPMRRALCVSPMWRALITFQKCLAL